MLLSGNAEVAFPPTTANLPTLAIAAAASATGDVAATAGRLDASQCETFSYVTCWLADY
jgi:hypothetical protein